MKRVPACKDCGSTTRKLTPPGPRCATCHREEKRRRRLAAHDRYVGNTYGLPPGMYERLYEAQGGVCALCRRATGKTKRLAVDHDHAAPCCTGKTSCGQCVRGLLCGPCNDVLAVARDDVEYFIRCMDYLDYPPMRFLNGTQRARKDDHDPSTQADVGSTQEAVERRIPHDSAAGDQVHIGGTGKGGPLVAGLPRVPEVPEGNDGGQVVPAQRPPDEKPVRRKRNHGSKPEGIPGIDGYVDRLTGAYRPMVSREFGIADDS